MTRASILPPARRRWLARTTPSSLPQMKWTFSFVLRFSRIKPKISAVAVFGELHNLVCLCVWMLGNVPPFFLSTPPSCFYPGGGGDQLRMLANVVKLFFGRSIHKKVHKRQTERSGKSSFHPSIHPIHGVVYSLCGEFDEWDFGEKQPLTGADPTAFHPIVDISLSFSLSLTLFLPHTTTY